MSLDGLAIGTPTWVRRGRDRLAFGRVEGLLAHHLVRVRLSRDEVAVVVHRRSLVPYPAASAAAA